MIQYSALGKHGRLGNALFELAATAGLGFSRNEPVRFPADWLHRPYFSVPDELFGLVPEVTEAASLPELAHIAPAVRAYMQDYSLFERSMPTIRGWLKPSKLAERKLEECEEFHQLPRPILSVHVRRGDNVPGQDPGVPDKDQYFVLPSLAFYREAIAEFSHAAASIAVFSDEPDWCLDNLPGDYFHRGVPRPKEHEADYLTAPVLDWVDLQLMAQCDFHVTTGSTYGIWGALLAGTGRVVRATPVYGPKLSFVNENLMFPPNWVKLEVRDAPVVRGVVP